MNASIAAQQSDAVDMSSPDVRQLLASYEAIFATMPPELQPFRPQLETLLARVAMALRDASQTAPPDVYAGPLLGLALTVFAQTYPKALPNEVAQTVWVEYANILTALGRTPPTPRQDA